MTYRITHRTTYKYRFPVALGSHVACLTPRSVPRHRLAHTELHIQPVPATITERVDYFGNTLCFFTVQEPHKELVVEARSEVIMDGNVASLPHQSLAWEEAVRLLAEDRSPEGREACQFRFESPRIRLRPEYAEFALQSFRPRRPLVEGLLDLTDRIYTDFQFDSKVTNVRTPTEEVFRKRRGVCQDFAHLQIACLRSLGLPARYVSGYLRTYPPPGKPRLVGADASHAWVSAYCPDLGWLDLDPTNNLVPAGDHVTLAWGRDYGDVSPLRGLIQGGGVHALTVAVDMESLEAL
jgi:transglutaminase-like putative cysteine protease